MKYKSIGCIADNTPKAQEALQNLISSYNIREFSPAISSSFDLIIVLGGDGFMLHTLHQNINYNIPFYGMNVGNVGFLLNQFKNEDLIERINKSKSTIIHPLIMKVKLKNGQLEERMAINEVSILRSSTQAAKIKISVNGAVRLLELICDGVMVSTPAGSSAYNFSVGGPIIPLGSNILALTPISPFRPRRWGGALLPHNATVKFDVLENDKRPINAVADFNELKDVVSVIIEEVSDKNIILLFDQDHSLEERITREQFSF